MVDSKFRLPSKGKVSSSDGPMIFHRAIDLYEAIMSVDSKLALPCNVRIEIVADVISRLYGNELVRTATFLRVCGKEIVATAVPHMATIIVSYKDNGVDEKIAYNYFFEYGIGGRLLMGRYGSKTVEVFKGVADFFGGTLDIDDCDDTELNYSVDPKSDSMNYPITDVDYDNLAKRIMAVVPVQ